MVYIAETDYKEPNPTKLSANALVVEVAMVELKMVEDSVSDKRLG